jgi:hypothetical protein
MQAGWPLYLNNNNYYTMGASCGGIAIEMNTAGIDLTKVVQDIFGSNFLKTDSGGDTRLKEHVFAGKTDRFLILTNSDFASQFFGPGNAVAIERCMAYFGHPAFAFAFEEYDSGGSYGYCLIYNGVARRQLRSLSYEIVINTGQPEPEEQRWAQYEIADMDVGDGEFIPGYKDPATGDFICEVSGMPQQALQNLMYEKLGFISWNMNEFLTEQAFFVQTEAAGTSVTSKMPESPQPQTAAKKPWWKLW